MGQVEPLVWPVEVEGLFCLTIIGDNIKAAAYGNQKLVKYPVCMSSSSFTARHIIEIVHPLYFEWDVVGPFYEGDISAGIHNFWKGYHLAPKMFQDRQPRVLDNIGS